MPLIPFPDIPAFPGVPDLPRLPSIPSISSLVPKLPTAGTVVRAGLGLLQGALWSALQTDRRWGIYDQDGNPLGDPSAINGLVGVLVNSIGLGSTLSTNTVDYVKEMRVSDFPIERGSFAQYNKVEMPGMPAVTLAFTGSESDRAEFLDAIDTACKSVDLYDVVTPEATYIQYSIEGYAYQRSAQRGATLLIVELRLKEIRQVSAQYTQSGSQAEAPANPDASPPVTAGTVQPLNPVQSVFKAVENKLTNLATTAAEQAKSAISSVFQ